MRKAYDEEVTLAMHIIVTIGVVCSLIADIRRGHLFLCGWFSSYLLFFMLPQMIKCIINLKNRYELEQRRMMIIKCELRVIVEE